MADNNKHDTFHMSYYFVNIAIRGFKETIHQNVDIFWDKVPCSSNGTIPGMPHVNPYVLRVKFQTTRGTYPALVTNPTLHGVGVPSRKFWNFSAAKATDQHIQIGIYCCKSKGWTRVLHGTPLPSYLFLFNLLDFLYGWDFYYKYIPLYVRFLLWGFGFDSY